MIRININGRDIEAEAGQTVLEAALGAGIYIPGLCYHPELPPEGACRLCIVEIEGVRGYPASCTVPVRDQMAVRTDTPRLQELRRNILWFILSEHPADIESSSQLKKVAEYIGIKRMPAGHTPNTRNIPVVSDDPLFTRDMNRCILCGRCVRICQEKRKTGVLGLADRGINTTVGTSYGLPLKDSACKFCLACVEVCPSGALADKVKFEEKDRENVLLPCTNTCPAKIDAARYVKLIAEGRYQDALEVIREKVPFPAVLGCVCDHPCEGECRRSQVNEPIAIRALKRFVAERDTGRWRSRLTIAPETGKKVAIAGSGPAGLSAAWYLRLLGHAVTVFEALPEAGGMMRIGIPEYRLPRQVLDREIREITDIGVELKTNARVESLDELFGSGFDAVFLAPGATEGIGMGIEGEDSPRVLDGISALKAINLKEQADLSGDVAVVGGGNVAIDAARSALRLGARKVTLLYRRTREEMPAAPEEVEEALEEGVEINFLTAPQRVLTETDRLEIECIRMQLGEPDSSGRRRPVPVEGSLFTICADSMVVAIGQRSRLPEDLAPLMNERGRIAADRDSMACSRDGVFAGGDAVSGPASVIKAIQAGRKAAVSIDRYLGGAGEIDKRFIPEDAVTPCLGREEGFAYRKRVKLPSIEISERLSGFPEVENCLSEKEALGESERCLRCELRLKISPAPLPEKLDAEGSGAGDRDGNGIAEEK